MTALLVASIARGQDIVVVDSDNFARGFHPPSMEQSVSWTAAFYDLSHRAIARAWGDREQWARTSIALFDGAAEIVLALPLSDAWVHEEFHRAVLGNRGVASFNDVYRFRPFADAIAVSHVRDDNLARMKREHPADLVRAHEAGIEGEHALVLRLERQHFFNGATSWNVPLYWLVKLNSIAYIASGTTNEANTATDKWERDEGAHMSRRDFTGHDFTAWVYDLFRPNEPYPARGPHPSGVGIRRYIRERDLTPAEHDFLHRQGQLSLINLLDPNLIGLTGTSRFNMSAGHLLTPFGYSIDGNLFLRKPRLFVTLHDYVNHERNFVGVDATLDERYRVALWRQPEHQMFRDRDGRLGGLVAARMQRGKWFGEVEAKSAGWVEGNVHLDRSITLRIGRAILSNDAVRGRG
ncbi:MAG TPA: hypothetical protein VER58_12470 [Thermoanaerobaculia bacterium]|nr:hypothetical protein [Thermoanaerobaculia bacterium]